MIALLLLAALGSGAWAQEPQLPPAPAEPHVDFTAEHMDYEKNTSMIHLSGAVRLRESTWTIKSDELWLESRTGKGRSQGFLLVEDGVSALYADGGEFDFREHTGLLHSPSAGHGDWRIHARSLRLGLGRRLDYSSADFTGCSYDPKPHYHFHASHLSVVPKDRLLAYNVLFYLGKVPIFYVPVLYKSLRPQHLLRFRVQPGYDRRNGAFLRSTLTTDHGRYVYSKLFLDYYSAQGLGVGGELHRRKGTDSRAALFGYRIRETSNGAERWALLGDGYQSLASSFSAQGRLQVQSDADFNNHYSRSSALRVTPELINNGALVYRLPSATARLSYARQDNADASKTRFIRETESYPRLDVQGSPFALWRLPWLNTLTGSADNNFSRGRPYIEKSAGGEWEATRTVPVVRGVSFTPKAAYSQTYLNRYDQLNSFSSTTTVRDAFLGRYRVEGTLRFGTPLGDWDLTQAYKRRQKANALTEDAGALDHGVETNLLSLQDAFRPTRRTFVRVGSGYDFRVFRDHELGFRRRVQPVVTEVTYSPRSILSLTLRDEFQLEAGHSALIFNGVLGDEEGLFLGAGGSYNMAFPDQYFASTDFGWQNSSGTVRFGGGLKSVMQSPGGVSRLHDLRLFEKELFIAKRWHDFFTRLQVRFRPGGVKEASIRIELKLPAMAKDDKQRKDWESEWFPERAREGDTDRP